MENLIENSNYKRLQLLIPFDFFIICDRDNFSSWNWTLLQMFTKVIFHKFICSGALYVLCLTIYFTMVINSLKAWTNHLTPYCLPVEIHREILSLCSFLLYLFWLRHCKLLLFISHHKEPTYTQNIYNIQEIIIIIS